MSKKNKIDVHNSDCTPETSLESEDVTEEENTREEDEPQEHQAASASAASALQVTHLMNRFDIPDRKITHAAETVEKDIQDEEEDIPRRRSEELLVDFGTRPRQQKEQNRRRGRVHARRWNSVVY